MARARRLLHRMLPEAWRGCTHSGMPMPALLQTAVDPTTHPPTPFPAPASPSQALPDEGFTEPPAAAKWEAAWWVKGPC